MVRKFVHVGAAIAVAASFGAAAMAGGNDYVFEPVKAEIKKGDDLIVSVRLKNKATGKPVSDAVIRCQAPRDMSRWPRRPVIEVTVQLLLQINLHRHKVCCTLP